MSSASGRKTGFSDRWRRLSGEVPQKSAFEQVHWVSEFGGLNLVKTPFFVRNAKFGSWVGEIVSEVADNAPGTWN
jgi:hypothetical protein